MGQATEYTETIETQGEPVTDWAPVIDLASRRSAA